MSDNAISVKNVSKSFKLPHEKHTGLKQTLINFRPGKKYETQKVLEDINFDVKKGEFFGIVGRNGSGKSTLLKLISNIYTPDDGSISVVGKLTPFIELGVGFNPELTGKENVFLNGALLGFNRQQMAEMYHEIVSFAELEKFMDQKLKNYSSGMQVRLAFSIAIRAKSDILILDEVLAVGDESFQRKCIDVFEEYKRSNQTVVLVTHDMESVRKFCDRAILIDSGNLLVEGSPAEVARQYEKLNNANIDAYTEDLNQKTKQPITIKLTNLDEKNVSRFNYSETAKIHLEWDQSLKASNAGVAIYSFSGEYVFGTNTLLDKSHIGWGGAVYEVELRIGPGRYYVVAAAFGSSDKDVKAFVPKGPAFTVDQKNAPPGQGLARLNHNWKAL